MNRITLAVFFALCATQTTSASNIPVGSHYDGRIQYVNYNAGDVVIIRAFPGLGTRIVFAPYEEILDVSSGFTQGWEFSDRRNILYLKPKSIKTGSGQTYTVATPKSGEWDTNLMVTTNHRMYDFDLKLLPNGDNIGKVNMNHKVAYRVEFKYPKEKSLEKERDATNAITQGALNAPPVPCNWAYSMQVGDKSTNIAPTMAYDDGRFTYLQFPTNRDFPAVFIVSSDKTESLVNTHVENDILVIHRVARALVLRLGNAVVGVYNDKYDMNGIPTTNGTISPKVKRVIVGLEED